MSQKPTDRDRFVPGLLNLLYNRVASTGTASYGRAFDLGIMDYRVLDVLADEPGIPARRIVEVISIDKGAVSRALKYLDGRGLLTATAPKDRQRLVYSLSAKGRQLHAEAHVLAKERERLVLDGVSRDDREHLVTMLHAIMSNVDKLKALADAQGPGAVSPP